MHTEQENSTFEYTYTPPTQKEREQIEHIYREYAQPQGSQADFARLKALHQKVHALPKITAITLGVIGTLLFGGGLALVLEFSQLVIGCILAAVGCLPVALSFPIYKKLLQKNKQKYGEEIVKLSEKLLEE